MAMQQKTLTERAAERLLALRDSEPPEALRQKAALCLTDYIGALVSGLAVPWACSLVEYAQRQRISTCLLDCACSELDGSIRTKQRPAHVVSLSQPVSAEVAAFSNAAIAHSVIRDDMHLQAGAHIGVMVIPAALALAERDQWGSNQLSKAIIGGYEMAAFLGEAIRSSKSTNEHFRPSGIIGAFGAAAAAIAGSRRDDVRVSAAVATNALGLAANMGAGLNEWAWAGGLEINTHMGSAARGGIVAFDLAYTGIESSATALEGKSGLFAAHTLAGNAHVAAKRFEDLLSTAPIGTGILGARFKPYAGCNFIQTPIGTAALLSKGMVEQDKVVPDIVSISVVTSTAAKDYPGCDFRGPFQAVQQSKMSLQYAVAAALLFRGHISGESYLGFNDEILEQMIALCHLETDVTHDLALSLEGRQPCRVVVQMRDGTSLEKALDDVPWLGDEAVKDRCRSELGNRFDDVAGFRILDAACGLQHGQCEPGELCILLAGAQLCL